MFRLQTRMWARNPVVPLEEYARLLRGALIGMVQYRTLGEIVDSMDIPDGAQPTDFEVRLILGRVQDEFESYQGIAERLEKIRPAPKELMEFHVRAVGFFRGFLVYNDRLNAGLTMAMQGKEREASKYDKEAEEWLQTFYRVRRDFSTELHRVRSEYPAIAEVLALPMNVLNDLYL